MAEWDKLSTTMPQSKTLAQSRRLHTGYTISCQTKALHTTNRDMTIGLRNAVRDLELHHKGIDADLVGPHSLRAGGAMALKLNGADDTTIMKMGRWSGLTFLQYIHNQIAHISTGLSDQMNTKLEFHNIAAIEKA